MKSPAFARHEALLQQAWRTMQDTIVLKIQRPRPSQKPQPETNPFLGGGRKVGVKRPTPAPRKVAVVPPTPVQPQQRNTRAAFICRGCGAGPSSIYTSENQGKVCMRCGSSPDAEREE
jgi:ribosomal protein L40E